MSISTQHAVMIEPTAVELLMLLRRRRKWTQAETAKKFEGLSARRLRSWEEGVRQPEEIWEREIMKFVKKHS